MQCHRCNKPSTDWYCKGCGEIFKKRREATPDVMMYVMEYKMRNPNSTSITIPDHWYMSLKLQMLNAFGAYDMEKVNRLMGGDKRTILGLKIETVPEEQWHLLNGEP